MKKRVVIIAFVLMAVVAMGSFADTFGIGVAYSINAIGGLPSSALLSLKVPQLPIIWGVGARIGGGAFNLAATADWWLIQQNLVSFLNIYAGPGLYISLPDYFEIGARIPVGLNAYPLDFLEIFAELALAHPFWTEGGLVIPSFRLQAAFGFRFWFDL